MMLYSKREIATLAAGLGISLAGLSGTGMAAGNESSQEHGTVVDGMRIFLGVIPSELIAKDYASSTPESEMHGGPPKGKHFHHVMVALYEEKNWERITDAKVTATVLPLGMSGVTKKMTPFDVAGAMTYCNYFDMPIYGQYRIDLKIARPGAEQPVKVQLVYNHAAGN